MTGRRYDAIVIGAGMSGLAAGIRLAQFDRPVVLLERHFLWGGLNSFYKLEGRRLDVGLHALTNYAPPRARGTPLVRVLRQLRIRHEELALGEQRFSSIHFPGATLTFSNDLARLEAEIERAFPGRIDGFRRLVRRIEEWREDEDEPEALSARAVLAEELSEPLLAEMLLCPVMIYGSPTEDDLDWDAYCVLFRSIFLEGLSRPEGGVRRILDLLVKRFRELGGELRMKTGVREVLVEDGRARGVVLDDGTVLEAERVLSSAGWAETMALCGREVPPAEVGRISFIESISALDTRAADLGHGAATTFFSLEERFRYRVPDELCELRTGVISAPGNFEASEPLEEDLMRLTTMANHDRWCALEDEEYYAAKERLADAAVEAAARYVPDWRPHTVFRDVFTPRTIRHYTGHRNGAVYGSPKKKKSGETGVEGLHLIGTDQGWLGVIGALVSGISMANRHVLAQTVTP